MIKKKFKKRTCSYNKRITLYLQGEITFDYYKFVLEYKTGIDAVTFRCTEMELEITFKNPYEMFEFSNEFGMWYNNKKD